ncbi:uncharacterized protein LOC131074670 [Cryptomeria japonica]|uniref:uncharacterized protein LOC131074670 n=1 Tax=Cryptomeria japonica TaxID=3369 RepID=UPI0027DA54F2|nr:uncharacterized protein LOC131074670 [Cryptomeria japonica]
MTILIPSRRPSLPPGRLKAGANPHYSLYKQIIGIKICPSKIKYEWWRLRAWRGEWKEFEDAVQEKELTRALRLLESLEYEDLELNNVGSSPSRNWEILDTCLNCQDMELVARSFQFLYDRGFLPNFGKFKNTGVILDLAGGLSFSSSRIAYEVIKGARNVTPAVLKDLTGVEASKFAPKKWGISGSSTLVSLASLAGISFLVNNGIDIRPKLAIILGLGVFDAVYLGGSLLAQILSIWPPYKRRIIVHEAGHLLIGKEQLVQNPSGEGYDATESDILRILRDNLQHAQNQQKLYADQQRIEHTFELGNMVYLRLQPYRQSTLKKSGVEKLNPRFYRPFRVNKRIGEVAYELELPASSRIHNVFHMSRLKKALGHNVVALAELPPLDEEGEIVLVPEAILDFRERSLRRREFSLLLRIHSCHVSSSGLLADHHLSFSQTSSFGELLACFIDSVISSIPFVFDGTAADFFDEPHVDETAAFGESFLKSIAT